MEPASEKNRRKSLYFHHIVKNKITICYNGAFYSLSLSLSLLWSSLGIIGIALVVLSRESSRLCR